MSVASALRARVPAVLPGRGLPGRGPLGLVPRRPRAVPRTPFVVTLLLLGGLGLVGLLVLNTTMQNRAFELSEIQQRGDRLAVREAALRTEVDALAAPQQVGSRAAELGMVPNPGPAFLRLSDGRVVGDRQPARSGTNLPGLEKPAPAPGTPAPAGPRQQGDGR